MAVKRHNPLPGFGLTMGCTMLYLSLIVLIPIGALFLRVFQVSASSSHFAPADFDDAPALVAQIKEKKTPLEAFLWEHFSETNRQQLASSDLATNQVEALFVKSMNGVLHDRSLYDTNRFADVGFGDRAKWYLKHEHRSAWANRSFLEDAYPFDIKKKSNWLNLWLTASSARAMAAYRLTFGASLIAALINAVFGTILAWVLVRYQFPGKRFFDALVDFPFALPTAVAGLTLANLFAVNGWLGKWLTPLGIKGAFTPLGVIIALTFIGLPFVVRTLQPVLENFEREVEEAAATLGAGRLRTFFSVVGPTLLPAIITGFALAFARAIGEYGSVIFISSNQPFKSEIAPLLIVIRLEEFDYPGAMAIAVVMLVVSFALLITINVLERWVSNYEN